MSLLSLKTLAMSTTSFWKLVLDQELSLVMFSCFYNRRWILLYNLQVLVKQMWYHLQVLVQQLLYHLQVLVDRTPASGQRGESFLQAVIRRVPSESQDNLSLSVCTAHTHILRSKVTSWSVTDKEMKRIMKMFKSKMRCEVYIDVVSNAPFFVLKSKINLYMQTLQDSVFSCNFILFFNN